MKKITILIISIACFAACKNAGTHSDNNKIDVTRHPVVIDTFPSSNPHLSTDDKGHTALSWIRAYNDSTYSICYTLLNSDGKVLGKTVEIPVSKNVHPHAESMPKIIFKPDGEIIAAWGGPNPNPKNKWSGLIYYSQSFDNGKTWNGPNLLVKDTASNTEAFFDMALLPNNEVGIVWLDNRTKLAGKEGSSLYMASTDGKDGFKNEHPIAATCCQCCRTDLYTDSKKRIHVAYRGIIDDSIRDMVHIISTDGGSTFSNPIKLNNDNWVIHGCPHTGPSMAENADGLHFAWYTGGNAGGIYYCTTTNDGKTFSKRDSIRVNISAKHPQMVPIDGNNLAIVWDETVKKGSKYNSWICLQLKSVSGQVTEPITPDSTVATFPVIGKTNGHDIVVAYTNANKGETHVYYQMITP